MTHETPGEQWLRKYTTDGDAASSTNIAAQFFRALASRVGP